VACGQTPDLDCQIKRVKKKKQSGQYLSRAGNIPEGEGYDLAKSRKCALFCHSVLDTESSNIVKFWIPAFAGMTGKGTYYETINPMHFE
jgi:hypothetical protein